MWFMALCLPPAHAKQQVYCSFCLKYIHIPELQTAFKGPSFCSAACDTILKQRILIALFAAGSTLFTQTWPSPYVCRKQQPYTEVWHSLLDNLSRHQKVWRWHAGADVLAWPSNSTVSPALSLQLHCLAEPALLKALVQQALPMPPPGVTPSHAPPPQQASTVRSLCQMLQAVAGVSALWQKALIFTAGPADFVQRLWMSYLKVCIWARSVNQRAAQCTGSLTHTQQPSGLPALM